MTERDIERYARQSRMARAMILAAGEAALAEYENRLWRDIPEPARIAIACAYPGVAWRAKDELLV